MAHTSGFAACTDGSDSEETTGTSVSSLTLLRLTLIRRGHFRGHPATTGTTDQPRMPNIKIFSGSSHPDLSQKIVDRLDSSWGKWSPKNSAIRKPGELFTVRFATETMISRNVLARVNGMVNTWQPYFF